MNAKRGVGTGSFEPSNLLVASAERAYVARLCQLIERDRRFRLVGLVASGDDLATSAGTPDVALVDLLVPGLSAPDAVKAFKGRRPRCAVAVRSSIDAPYLRGVAAEADVDAFVVSSTANRDLLDALASLATERTDQATSVDTQATT